MNKNILTFDEWAILGKDEGMEKGHHASVQHMTRAIFNYYQKKNKKYSLLDLGCGNGWVVRKFKEHSLCNIAHGIDGAPNMIKKAKKLDKDGTYFNENIEKWDSDFQYDAVFSMETLYYFQNPSNIIKNLYNKIINENGMLIIGVDHYKENAESLNWGQKFNLEITTLSCKDWIDIFKNTGFKEIKSNQVEAQDNWAGTLIVSGIK